MTLKRQYEVVNQLLSNSQQEVNELYQVSIVYVSLEAPV